MVVLSSIFNGLVIAGIFSFVLYAFATPPDSPYTPGATLSPSCAPGSTNCSVTTPAVSGANSDITSLSGLTTPLTSSQGGTGLSSFTAGDILYYATGSVLSKLGIGTADKLLTSSGTAPQWSNIASLLTAGTNISISGTTNATLAVSATPSFTTVTATGLGTFGSLSVGTLTGILKAATGAISAATDGTDYLSPTTGLKTTDSSLTLPTIVGQSGKYLTTNGSALSWGTIDLSGYQPLDTGLTSLAGLTYASTSFVKMTGTDTFSLDTNTYYKSGDTATFANITDSGLTATRVPYASTAGLLVDSANLTFDGTTLTAGGLVGPLQVSSTTGVNLTASNGVLTMAGLGDSFDEDLTWDFNTIANTVTLDSTTGVTDIISNIQSWQINRLNITTNAQYPGLTLKNLTAATSGTTRQYSPALILSGQAWYNSADVQYQWAISGNPTTSNLNYFSIYSKKGTEAWTQTFNLRDNGNIETSHMFVGGGPHIFYSSIGEAVSVRQMTWTSSDATSGTDQFSPTVVTYGEGWKTEATAASQVMVIGNLVAPEQGTVSPVGVFKFIFGTNTATPVVTNELFRLKWGSDSGSLGAVFNDLALSGYDFRIEGNTDANLFVTYGTNDKVGIGTATPTNAKLVVIGGIAVGADALNNTFDIVTGGDGSTTMYIGNSTINVTAPSDINVKENIISTSYGLADLLKFSVKDFEYKKEYVNEGEAQKKHTGLIAQEVEAIYPEAMIYRSDNLKAVDYNKLVPLIIKSIQDLATKGASGALSETGTLGTGQVVGVETNSFVSQLKDTFVSLGVYIEKGIATVEELIAQKAAIKTARIDKMEMVDSATGEIWCTWIENGEWQKTKGDCAGIEIAVATQPIPTPTPTPEPTPQPQPEVQPEVIPQPQPEMAPQITEELKQGIKEDVKEEVKQELKQEVKSELKSELKTEIKAVREDVKELKEDVSQISEQTQEQQTQIEQQSQQQEQVQQLEEQIEQQQEQIQELEESQQPAALFRAIKKGLGNVTASLVEPLRKLGEFVKNFFKF